jgi:D-amino-acid dehydrogenase
MTAEKRHADVLIVGGGIVGLTCAEALSRAGRAVTVLEQGDLGRGSSWANCGLITPSHALPLALPGVPAKTMKSMFHGDAPFYIKPRLDASMLIWGLRFFAACNVDRARRTARAKQALLALSRVTLAQLIRRECLECEWTEAGLYFVYQSQQSFEAGNSEDRLLSEVGIECEKIDGSEMSRREPAVKSGMAGARFYSIDAHLRPDKLISELVRVLGTRGVTFVESCSFSGVIGDTQRVSSVMTSSGEIEVNDVVIATGAWTPALAKQLGLKLPIQPGKGYTITLERGDGAPRVPLIFKEPSVAVTPWESGLRIGSTMEFVGYDRTLNPARLEAIRRGARAFMHTAIDHGQQEEWYGWRPMTPDDLPAIGAAPRYRNVTIAAGHGMLGVSMSTGTAELVSALVCGAAPPLDPTPYSPLRFRSFS